MMVSCVQQIPYVQKSYGSTLLSKWQCGVANVFIKMEIVRSVL
jgi:hypothetical protein